MNKYPAWLNALVLTILLAGIILALPNIYGSAPAVQLAQRDGADGTTAQLEEYVRVIDNAGIESEAAYIADGRAVIRFEVAESQRVAGDLLRDNYRRTTFVALTRAPCLPDWIRALGLNPMSLGLDLRGGVPRG